MTEKLKMDPWVLSRFTPTNPPKHTHTHTESRTNHLLDHWCINKPHLLYISLLLHSCLLSASLFCFYDSHFLSYIFSDLLHLFISCSLVLNPSSPPSRVLPLSPPLSSSLTAFYIQAPFCFCWITPSEFYRRISLITNNKWLTARRSKGQRSQYPDSRWSRYPSSPADINLVWRRISLSGAEITTGEESLAAGAGSSISLNGCQNTQTPSWTVDG